MRERRSRRRRVLSPSVNLLLPFYAHTFHIVLAAVSFSFSQFLLIHSRKREESWAENITCPGAKGALVHAVELVIEPGQNERMWGTTHRHKNLFFSSFSYSSLPATHTHILTQFLGGIRQATGEPHPKAIENFTQLFFSVVPPYSSSLAHVVEIYIPSTLHQMCVCLYESSYLSGPKAFVTFFF